MKRLPLIAVVTASILTTACALLPMDAKSPEPGADTTSSALQIGKADLPADQIMIQDEAGSVVVQKVGFRPGVSSATVERLAKRYGCDGSAGAGLVTDKGPVEVYRMQCDNGTTFIARCELRQCRPMR